MADEEEDVTFDQSTLLTNRLKPRSKKRLCRKLLKTLGVSIAFLALGLCIAIPGPTLLDLMDRVNTDTQHIAYIFTARSAGYLLGSIMGGFLFDRFDQQLLLFIILFFTAIATAGAPWCQNLLVLAVMISFQGISMGFLDTGGNVYCIRIWGRNSGPYMQFLHFCFGVGAFIAPLLAKPFLSTTIALQPGFNNSSSGFLHVQRSNIPLVLPEFKHFGDNNDDNEVRYRRYLDNEIYKRTETFTKFPAGTVSNLSNSSSTASITTTTSPVAKKPVMASDDTLNDKFADGIKIREHLNMNKKIIEDNAKTSTTRTPTTLATPANSTVGSSSSPASANDTDNRVNLNTTFGDTSVSTENPAINQGDSTESPSTEPVLSSAPTTVTPSTLATTSMVQEVTTLTSSGSSGQQTTEQVATDLSQATQAATQSSISPGNSNTSATNNDTLTVSSTSTTAPATTVRPHKPGTTVDEFVHKTLKAIKNMSNIQFAYVIIAGVLLFSSVLFLVIYCWERQESSLASLSDDDERGEITESQCFRLQMLTLLFFFYFMYVGMEVTYGGFIMTFAVQFLSWSKDEGTVVTAIFWGAMAAGRGIAVFMVKCIRPSVMLIINLLLSLVASLILTFGVKHYHFLLWPGTLIFGLGLSSIFPTGLSWAERYMKLTGKATAVMVVGSALGEMCVPAVTGYFFSVLDMMSLMYTMLVLSAVASILFVIMQKLASNRGDRYSVSKFLELEEGESIEMSNTPGHEVEIFSRESATKKRKVKFNLKSNGSSYKPLRSSEEE